MNEQKKGPVTRTAGVSVDARGIITELRRVTWPTRDEWVAATVLTVGLVVVIGLFTFGLDQLFGWVFDQIHLFNI